MHTHYNHVCSPAVINLTFNSRTTEHTYFRAYLSIFQHLRGYLQLDPRRLTAGSLPRVQRCKGCSYKLPQSHCASEVLLRVRSVRRLYFSDVMIDGRIHDSVNTYSQPRTFQPLSHTGRSYARLTSYTWLRPRTSGYLQ